MRLVKRVRKRKEARDGIPAKGLNRTRLAKKLNLRAQFSNHPFRKSHLITLVCCLMKFNQLLKWLPFGQVFRLWLRLKRFSSHFFFSFASFLFHREIWFFHQFRWANRASAALFWIAQTEQETEKLNPLWLKTAKVIVIFCETNIRWEDPQVGYPDKVKRSGIIY